MMSSRCFEIFRDQTERVETGLNVLSATPFALYSNSRYSFAYSNGDKVQMFVLVFRVDDWDGDLVRIADETMGAEFFPMDDLPDLHEVYAETLEDLRNYNGNFIFGIVSVGVMEIRGFEIRNESAVVKLWKECDLVVPWNNPHSDIQRKLKVQPEMFLVACLIKE